MVYKKPGMKTATKKAKDILYKVKKTALGNMGTKMGVGKLETTKATVYGDRQMNT